MSIINYLNLPYELESDYILFKDLKGEVSYNEFMQKITAAASYFKEKGIRGKVVGIRAYHEKETLIAMLGVLLSGNYYALIGDSLPEGVLNKIGQKLDLSLVIDNKESENEYLWDKYLNKGSMKEQYEAFLNKLKESSDDEIMYIIFTSGSTGIPKGIIKSHGAMISFLDSYIKEFDFKCKNIFGNQTPFYFDASAKDIFTVLAVRAEMVILDSGLFMKPVKLLEYLNEEKVDVIQWVPSALSILSSLGALAEAPPEFLKKVLFVGEAFDKRQLKKWMDMLPETEFINLYGFSEIAGICAFCRLRYKEQGDEIEWKTMELFKDEELPIGKALDNCEIYLMDKDRNEITEPGVEGEIYVKSPSLAKGYLDDDEENNKYFLSILNDRHKNGPYYYSKDMAVYDKNGNLMFSGRKDHQIKHMGRRIELTDIEHGAMEIPQVEDACCVFHKNKIVLYVAGNIDKSMVAAELKLHLADYMLPHKICILDEIPLNGNGKKDRVLLAEMSERKRRRNFI